MADVFTKIQHDARIHATLASTGFIILLPIGMLIPRYTRTSTAKWFWMHAAIQLLIAGPIIIAGFAYGVTVANLSGTTLQDPHTKGGVALFILYVCQVLLGITSHFFKRPHIPIALHRSPHQILHIILGLTIFALAFWQVHYGYTIEWPSIVGSKVPSSVDKAWKALVIIFPILYLLGFVFFPKQLSQESAHRKKADGDNELNNTSN